MAGIQVNTLNNANIYIDGNSLLGQFLVVRYSAAYRKL